MIMTSFGMKLNQLKKARGLTVKDLAAALDVSTSTIYMYMQGNRVPSTEMLEKIADFFNVDLDYLQGRSNIANRALENRYNASISEASIFNIPILGEVACGLPLFAEQNIIGYTCVEKKDRIDFALYAKGDSMTAARILDGDLVFIRQQNDVENGEIALVLVDNDTATLKRLYKYDDKIELRPDSFDTSFYPQVYEKSEHEIKIQGKVIFIKTFIK
jgi:repressor LexA